MRRNAKKRGKQLREEVTYCIKIAECELSYSFSLAVMKDIFPGPFWEHAGLEISGKLIHPEKVKGRILSGTILGARDLAKAVEDPANSKSNPLAIGDINLRGKESSFLVSVPFDALPFLYNLFREERFKYLILDGFSLNRSTSEVKSVRFKNVVDSDDS